MSTRFKRLLNTWLPVVALAIGAATSAQAAAVYVEGGDAGESILTAANFSGTGPIDAIRGTLDGDADMFAIYLTAGTAFTGTTTVSGFTYNAFDTVLYLFDAAGNGLLANDDDGDVSGAQSTISNYIPTISGIYYLAITGAGYTPVGVNGAVFPSLWGQGGNVGPLPGAGALTGWESITQEFGDYEIVLTGASVAPAASGVPEPASLLLAGVALGAAGLVRRRKSAAAAAINA